MLYRFLHYMLYYTKSNFVLLWLLPVNVWPLYYRQQIDEFQGAFQAPTPQFRQALAQIQWNPQTVQDLQQAVLNGPQITLCSANDSVSNLLQNNY